MSSAPNTRLRSISRPTLGVPLVLLALLLSAGRSLAAPAAPGPAAPAGPPAPASPSVAPAGRFEDMELRRGKEATRGDHSAGTKGGAANAPGAADGQPPAYDLPRVLLALGAVIGLIFLLRWAARRFFGLPTAGRSSQVVQVLSRSVLSPKQQLLLVKVGRRVLVAADNGSQLTALSEITDPDEVAALVGQLRSEKDAGGAAAAPGKAFQSLFGRAKNRPTAPSDPVYDYEDNGQEADEGSDADEEDGEGEEVLAERPGYPPARPGADLCSAGSPGRAPGDSGLAEQNVVAATRQELSGLLEKVRLVSDQFNRTGEPGRPRDGRAVGK